MGFSLFEAYPFFVELGSVEFFHSEFLDLRDLPESCFVSTPFYKAPKISD